MKLRLPTYILTLLCSTTLLHAQFTLDSEYAKQRKRYPHIIKAEYAPSDAFRFVPNVVYTLQRTESLTVDLFLPIRTSANRPVLLLVHGGGWESGDKSLDHPLAAALARQGIAAVCVQYRLSGEAPYPAAIQDVCTAIRWVKKHAGYYGWSATDVSLLGSSAGGQIVSLVGSLNTAIPKYMTDEHIEYDVRVRRVIDIDGVQAFLHADSSESSTSPNKSTAASRWLGSHPSLDKTPWLEASALTHVSAHSAEFLYLLSSYPRFSAGYKEMMRSLQAHKIPTAMHHFPDTPHTFWLFHPWFDQVVELVKHWVRHSTLPE